MGQSTDHISYINRLRIRKLWRDVEEYNKIIQLARKHDNLQVAIDAANAKLSTLAEIERLYNHPATI